MLEPGYAYVRIRAFQERTIHDLEDELGCSRRSIEGSGRFDPIELPDIH